MFGFITDLTKAAIGVVVETPVAIVADIVTLGGALTDEDKPYTVSAISKVVENIENSTKAD